MRNYGCPGTCEEFNEYVLLNKYRRSIKRNFGR